MTTGDPHNRTRLVVRNGRINLGKSLLLSIFFYYEYIAYRFRHLLSYKKKKYTTDRGGLLPRPCSIAHPHVRAVLRPAFTKQENQFKKYSRREVVLLKKVQRRKGEGIKSNVKKAEKLGVEDGEIPGGNPARQTNNSSDNDTNAHEFGPNGADYD